MSRSQFVAARSSRHRVAALALYRALIRTAGQVPIPQQLRAPGPRSSLVKLVRKRFVKNTPFTSFRLIYASMAVGYKFLALFVKAQTAGSPEHAQVITLIQKQHRSSKAPNAAHPRQLPSSPSSSSSATTSRPAPASPAGPLLINVARPGEPPKYTSTILPRPASSSSSSSSPPAAPRRIPIVSATADGQPFLRITKPQPHTLSRMVGRKGRLFSNRIASIMEVDEEWVPQAALEDEWDALIRDLRAREAPAPAPRGPGMMVAGGDAEGPAPHDHERTFGWSVQLSRLWFEYKIESTWEDWLARGDALQELVQREKALREQETAAAGGHQARPAAMRAPRHADARGRDADLPPPNVGRSPATHMPVIAALRAHQASAPAGPPAQDDPADPFTSDTWAALVRSQTKRMLVWLKRGSSGANAHEMPWKTARREVKARESPREE
ncbi:hypothetical protein ESCO_001874 [Escovopsis weberi]|uniref:Uncharacterized protein n=1 Tax=Escovopsis weberi TaxID=150374 RepID=A0A0M8N3J5_ESCWE|nr:hypothetical protein ESCO_001874 [Escovopsis weberi]